MCLEDHNGQWELDQTIRSSLVHNQMKAIVTRVFNETTVKQEDISGSKYHQMVEAVVKRKAQHLRDISKGVSMRLDGPWDETQQEKTDTNEDKRPGRGKD